MSIVLQSVGVLALVVFTYVASRYASIVHALDAAFQGYGGTCEHEHSLYDVEESYRHLRIVRRVYFVSIIAIYYMCFTY